MTQTLDKWEDTAAASQALVVQAEGLKITDQKSYEQAVLFRQGVKKLVDEILAAFKPQKQAVDAAKKVLLEQEKARLEGPNEALEIVNRRLAAWDTEQRQKRRQAEIDAAREAKETGQIVPARSVPAPAPVAGFSFSTHYRAQVTDILALCRAVADGKLVPQAVAGVQAVLDDFARQIGPLTKAEEQPGTPYELPGVPGVSVVAERRPRGK